MTSERNQIEQLAAEADAIRCAYRDFWGAHTIQQIIDVHHDPSFPDTPVLDRWYPRDGSVGLAGERKA